MCHQTIRRCSTRSDDEYNPSISRVTARRFDPYYREYKSNDFDWDRYKVFTEDDPVVVLVPEPHDIYNFLDNGMSIWIMWTTAEVGYL